jgi:DNA primase
VPKYLNSPETELFNKRDLLYGLPQVAEGIRKENAALVVEGYTDVLMLYQAGTKNAVATLGTATTPAHLRTLSGYADRIYLLFDPDAAGEKAIERAAATASELKVDLRVLRLPQDPADWLLEHPPEEFSGMLEGAVPVLEYSIRRITEQTRGADAVTRSRAVPEVQSLINGIKDPVLHEEAIRLATEALGVDRETLRSGREGQPDPSRNPSAVRHAGRRMERSGSSREPLSQAGRQVLALILTRPDLTAEPLRSGVHSAPLPEPLVLEREDFAEEDEAALFSILRDNAGGDLGTTLADERARPLMDLISALSAEGEKLYPSAALVREVWIRLRVLRLERDKRDAADYDRKEQLHNEVQLFQKALRAVAS